MPPYLAFYAWWTLATGPATWLGGLTAKSPEWLQISITRGLAVVGLSLWVFPLAAVVLAEGLRGIPQSALDALSLERAGRFRRSLVVLGMMPGSVAAAMGLVALIMLSSAVPLHLAQIPTLAINVWTDLSLGASAGEAWLRAYPVVAAAGLGSAVLTWRLSQIVDHPPKSEGNRPVRLAPRLATAGIWFLAVGAPLLLAVVSLREWASLGRFWHLSGRAVGESAVVAGVTGIGMMGLAAGGWCALSCRVRTLPRVRAIMVLCTFLWLLAGLTPGVLAGAAVRGFWNQPWLGSLGDFMERSPLLLALGHIVRFGCIGLVAAWLLARQEPASLRDMRRLHGAERLADWVRLVAKPKAGVVLGIGLLGFALSMHEIEATVILSPPGSRVLAQQILEHLHYNYVEEMSAAMVNLLVATGVVAWAAGVLLVPGRSRPHPAA